MIFAPEVEERGCEEQFERDDSSYREQLFYVLEHSPLHRAKLAGAGITSTYDAGGLERIAQLPLTEKQELKLTTTAENPIGAHLCAADSEIVRIYSTSGTTGAPSFIPLTASDLENWVAGSARSYAASGVKPGDRLVSTYTAGPIRGGRRTRRV